MTLGMNRSVYCKTAREKSSGNWILFLSKKTGRLRKNGTVAFACNYRKKRLAFERQSPPSSRYTTGKAVGNSY